MKIINSVITVQLTSIDQATLSNAYTILNELYKIIDENDCELATNTLTDESYDRSNRNFHACAHAGCNKCLPMHQPKQRHPYRQKC